MRMLMIFPDDRFGRWLRSQRLRQGLTPEQLAQEACCDAEAVLQLEQGELLELDAQLCRRLLKALSVSPDTLFPPDDI